MDTMDGILSDRGILNAISEFRIKIDPFDPDQVNPTSYDVTLGEHVAVYEAVTYSLPSGADEVPDGRNLVPIYGFKSAILDVRKPNKIRRFRIDPVEGWVLKPGIGYLMHTKERISTDEFVPVLDGKSSIGRLFVSIHETAGFCDPGFSGQLTLEVTCTYPVRLYPGMRIGQVRFHTISGEVEKLYSQTGKYKENLAEGPVESQAFKMFSSQP
jgi:dCTP deaminase